MAINLHDNSFSFGVTDISKMETTQTAVSWLIEEIHKNMVVWIPPHIQEQAKQMESDKSKADCDVARMQGWNKGYEDGLDEGFSKGYEEGYEDGRK